MQLPLYQHKSHDGGSGALPRLPRAQCCALQGQAAASASCYEKLKELPAIAFEAVLGNDRSARGMLILSQESAEQCPNDFAGWALRWLPVVKFVFRQALDQKALDISNVCGFGNHLSVQNKGAIISPSFKDTVPIVFMKVEVLPNESRPRAQ